MEGCTDGTWQEKRCFSCKYGRGFFCPVTALHPDQRFADSAPAQAGNRVLIDISSLCLLPPLQLYKLHSKKALINQCLIHTTTWVIRRVSKATRTPATWTPLSLVCLPSVISLMKCSCQLLTALTLTSTDKP